MFVSRDSWVDDEGSIFDVRVFAVVSVVLEFTVAKVAKGGLVVPLGKAVVLPLFVENKIVGR